MFAVQQQVFVLTVLDVSVMRHTSVPIQVDLIGSHQSC
jgi:hypothetical protein